MMMSGPLPTLAATAAFGRTSSQPSLSTRTSMPVCCVNFFVLASHMSSSPCTNFFQRSTRSFAPFSGFHWPWASASDDHIAPPTPSDPAAAAPAVVLRKSRLVNLDIAIPPGLLLTDRPQRLSRRRIEQMRALVIGSEADRLARAELVALAEHRRHLRRADLGEHLRVRARRLDHHHLGVQPRPARGEREVLGPRAVDHRLPVLARRILRHGHARPALQLRLRAAVGAPELRREEVHRRRA